MKNNISVVIAVYNSAKYIEDCLKSVQWADEIVVVDDGSVDNTIEIVKKYTDKIYPHKSQGFVEPTRNFAISKATNEWVLILDADERVPDSLIEELQRIAEEDREVAVSIPRKNIIFDKWMEHTGWWPDYNIRFFKKGKITWSDKIHSHPQIDGEVFLLPAEKQYALMHYNYESVSQFIQKLDRYTTVTAQQKMQEGYTFQWTHIITEPFQEYLRRYFARRGYKDGLHGLVLSVLLAFYELIIYCKLWELNNFIQVDEKTVVREFKTLRNSQKELRYWLDTKRIDEASNKIKRNYFKVKRRIGI